MKTISGVGGTALAEHSHEEVWNLVPGLNAELKQLARDLLPAIKRSKRLVIRLGAASLQDELPEVIVAFSYELAATCNDSVRQITDRYADALNDGLIGPIVRDIKYLGDIATVIATFGMDEESARSMRLAYRSFRNSCALLWLYEFAPEGRPQFKAGGS